MIFCYHEWASVMPVIVLSEKNSYKSFSGLPNWIESEILELCRDFGFIEWRIIEFDEKISPDEKEYIGKILDNIKPEKQIKIEDEEEKIQSFFEEMNDILSNIIIPSVQPKFGLFRFASPYDIDVRWYNWWLSDFLDFLNINLRESVRFYGEKFFSEIENNCWLLLDYSKEKNFFYFSEESSTTLNKTITIKEIHYPVIIRIIPGFASPGFYFLLSIDTGEGGNNICMQIGVRFEKIDDIITPVIHNIQTPMYHLGINSSWLMTKAEIPPDAKPAKELLSQKSLYDFVGSVVSAFFSWGYTNTQIIDGHESLWLKYHNKNRTEESIEQSTRIYREAGKHITGIETNEGRTSPTLNDILKHEISRISKLGFEEDCLWWIFTVVQRFVINFSREIKIEEMNTNERELFFSYIGEMREALLWQKINPELHSENK